MSNLSADDKEFIDTAHSTLQSHCSAAWKHLAEIKETLSLDDVDDEVITTKVAVKNAALRLRAKLVEAIAHIDSIKDDFPVDVTP